MPLSHSTSSDFDNEFPGNKAVAAGSGSNPEVGILTRTHGLENGWERELPYLPKALTEEEIEKQRRDPESRILLKKLFLGGSAIVVAVFGMILFQGGEQTSSSSIDREGGVVGSMPAGEVSERGAPLAGPVVRAGVFELMSRERPTSPVLVRVWARKADSFDGRFSDSEWLNCIQLTAADDPDGPVLRAYVEKTSATGGAADFRLRQGGGEAQQWTVRVRYPAGAEGRDQVWLDEIVSTDWEVDDQP